MTKTLRVPKNLRVRHAARGFWMYACDVEQGVANCALAWVVKGESFRDLTEAEAAAARKERARRTDPLDLAEIYGVRYAPPERATEAYRREMALAREAGRVALALQAAECCEMLRLAAN